MTLGLELSKLHFFFAIWLKAKMGHKRQKAKKEAGRTCSFQFYLLLVSGSPQQSFSILAAAVYFPHLQNPSHFPPQKAAPVCSCPFRGPSMRPSYEDPPSELLGYQQQPFSFNNLSLCSSSPSGRSHSLQFLYLGFLLPFSPPITLQPIP